MLVCFNIPSSRTDFRESVRYSESVGLGLLLERTRDNYTYIVEIVPGFGADRSLFP